MRASLWTLAGLRAALRQIAEPWVRTGALEDDAATNAKLANMEDSTIKGRASGAGTGDPTDLTADQVRTIIGTRSFQNLLVNGGFSFAQRQAAATLTTYSNTSGRTYGPDYWCFTNENASVQFARGDLVASPVTGLSHRYRGRVKKITNAGKVILSQIVEAEDMCPVRGRTVFFQAVMLNVTGSTTVRMILLQLTSAGTADTPPATFVSAFGANTVDPTWGTNLSAITPSTANANCSISGAGLTCTLSGTATVFGGTFVIPTNCVNLIACFVTDSQMAVNDVWNIAEAGIYDGTEQRIWIPESTQVELARVQRRCWKTFPRDVAPVQNNGLNTGEFRGVITVAGAAGNRLGSIPFPVPMRTTAPTITTYNPSATNAEVRDITANADCSATTVGNSTDRGTAMSMTGNAAGAVGNQVGVHILAEDNL